MDPIFTQDAAAKRFDYLSSLPLAKLKQEQEKEKAAGSYTPQTQGLYEALASDKVDEFSSRLSTLPSKQIAYEFRRGLAQGEYDDSLKPVAAALFGEKFKSERAKSGLEKTGDFASSAGALLKNEAVALAAGAAAPFGDAVAAVTGGENPLRDEARKSQVIVPFIKGAAKSIRDVAKASNYFGVAGYDGVPVEEQEKAMGRLYGGLEAGTRETAGLVRDIFDDAADEDYKARGDASLTDIFEARLAEQGKLVDAEILGSGYLATLGGLREPISQFDEQDRADVAEMKEALDATNAVPFAGGFKIGASGISRALQSVAGKIGLDAVETGLEKAAKVVGGALETGPKRQILGTPLMTAEEALIRQAKTDGLLRKARLAAGSGTVKLGESIQTAAKALPAAGTSGVAAAGLTLAAGGDAQEAVTAGLAALVGRKLVGGRLGLAGAGAGLQKAGRVMQTNLPTPFSKTQAAINAFRTEYRPIKSALAAAGLGAVETGLISLGADTPEEAGAIVGGGAALGAVGSGLGTLQAFGRDQLVKKAAGVTNQTAETAVPVAPLGFDAEADKINAEAVSQMTPAGSVFLQTARAMLPNQHVYVAMTGDQAQAIYSRLTGDQTTDVRNVNGLNVAAKDGKQLVIIRPAGTGAGITGEAGGHEVTHALKAIALADPKTRGAWFVVEDAAREALGPEGSEVFEGVKQQYLSQMPPGSNLTEQQVVDEFIAEHGSVILSGLPAGKLGGNKGVAQTLASAFFRLAENAGLRKVGFARDSSDPVTSSTLPYTPSFNLLDALEYAINASRLESSDLVPDSSVPNASPVAAPSPLTPSGPLPSAVKPVAPRAGTFSGGPGVLTPIPTSLATDQSVTPSSPPQQPVAPQTETPASETPTTPEAPSTETSVNAAIRGQDVQAARTESVSPLTPAEETQLKAVQPDEAKQDVARKVWQNVKALGGQRIGLPVFEAAINQDGVVRSKRVAPYDVEVSSTGKVTVLTVDMDRVNYNGRLLFDWAKKIKQPTYFGYSGINDPKFVADLGTYLRNQAEGRRGSGQTLTAEGVPPSTGTPAATLTREQEQFFNILMGQTPPAALTTRSALAIARIRATAKASGIEPRTTDTGSVEPNALRDALRKEGAPIDRIGEDPDPTRRQSNLKDRNSVIARIRLQDFESLTPTGQSISQPNIRAIEASFMPGNTDVEFSEFGRAGSGDFIARKDGKEIGFASVSEADPNRPYLSNIRIISEERGKGIGSAFYDFIEKSIGKKLRPSPLYVSKDARRVWARRGEPSFMPSAAGQPVPQEPAKARFSNPDVRRISKQYVEEVKLPYRPHEKAVPVREETAKRIADFYDKAADSPNDPEVKAAYTALANEVVAQWKKFEDAGYVAELWTGEGQPYADSAAMMKDVRDNKHIYYFGTEGGFGLGGITPEMRSNPMLAQSGVNFIGAENVPVNDVFRVVHDIVGHGAHGYEFGPKGEFNAYLEHSRMFSDAAKPALAAETLAQNSWVNFGPHLRNPDGSLPKKGDKNFIPPAERRFADQKNILVPKEILDEVDAYAREAAPQLMPANATASDFSSPETVKDLPNKRGWAIMTAENPRATPLSAEENRARNKQFQREQEARGAELIPALGKYGTEENPFVVIDPSLTFGKAVELANQYEQESVLTPYGFAYADGSLLPIKSIQTFDTPPSDFYTKVGDTYFSAEFAREFGDSLPADSIEVQSLKASEAAENAVSNLMQQMRELGPKFDKARVERANPFDGPVGSGWLLENGEFRWANSIASHDALARFLGYKNIEDARDNGGLVRSWGDRDDRIITLGVDEFSDLTSVRQDRVEKLAKQFKAAIRDDRGNIVLDYRDDAPSPQFMPSLASAKVKGPNVQFKRERPIKGAVGGVLDIVHFSSKDLKQIDPAKGFGKGAATQIDRMGAAKAFFYVKGTAYEAPIATRSNVYTAKVDGNSIYDLNTDVLGVQSIVNREKRDQAIKDAGFKGFYAETPGFDAVAIYDKIDVTPSTKEDVMTTRQMKALGIETPAERKRREKADELEYARFQRVGSNPDGTPRFMPAKKDALGLYSQLEKTLEAIPEKASRQQIEAALRDGVKEKGVLKERPVKQEEMADVKDQNGVSFADFLKANPEASKADMLEFVKASSVQVSERVSVPSDLEDRANALEDGEELEVGNGMIVSAIFDEDGEVSGALYDPAKGVTERGFSSPATALRAALKDTKALEPGYEDYQLPGGENYREVVLTLPAETPVVGKTLAEVRASKAARGAGYESSHFRDVPNYLAHARFNERSTADGSKVFFVEEIQSDLHQEGRKKGYNVKKSPQETSELNRKLSEAGASVREAVAAKEPLEIAYDAARKKAVEGVREVLRDALGEQADLLSEYSLFELIDKKPAQGATAGDPRIADIRAEYQTAYDALNDASEKVRAARAAETAVANQLSGGGTPDAPFKKSWPEMVFKTLLNKAAQSGSDFIAWTTGEQQAARYDLSKQLDRVVAERQTVGDLYEVTAYSPRGGVAFQDTLSADKLEDTVGKDLAQKIVSNPEKKATYTGLDLKVGGEGMKGFYDKILPSLVDKYAKKWGAKTEMVAVDDGGNGATPWKVVDEAGRELGGPFPTKKEAVALANAVDGVVQPVKTASEVHALRITPEMRKDILENGQPRYMPAVQQNARTGDLSTSRVAPVGQQDAERLAKAKVRRLSSE